ncbi:MAG: ABC transporter substrate-binding protein [Pseudomonadota bacterium]|nr:ABC transporter substrate-binding protein [Pseudomonadota bacterium]
MYHRFCKAPLPLLAVLVLLLSGCGQRSEPLLRIASNVWPGYEMVYLARELKYFDTNQIRLVEFPSATAGIQALAAGSVEGAMLTLDEVLGARAEGLSLQVVAVLDVSVGADVLLARPSITSLQELRGKRIGVEHSAVGAIMLDAVLSGAGLTMDDVEVVHTTVNRHPGVYREGKVDAVITFEPVRTRLIKEGAVQLFDSSEIVGRIVDVLAVLPKAAERSPSAISTLVAAHFSARDHWLQNPDQASPILARRLLLQPEEVAGAYTGIQLTDLATNRTFLQGPAPKLEEAAERLSDTMVRAGLLDARPDLSGLVDGSHLPD